MIKLEYTDIFHKNEKKELVFSKHLLTSPYNEKSLFVTLVDGKSMQPVINDRAIIIADLSQKELEDNKIYLIYYDERLWVKKYDKKKEVFFSINLDFSHLVYKKDLVKVVAKVLITFTTL